MVSFQELNSLLIGGEKSRNPKHENRTKFLNFYIVYNTSYIGAS